ncbi:MAG TPA: tetratricopeptide repeat protein, partial [bacterium]|nr:tetratricopeptide repeat protein [bacterium]
EPKPAPKPVTKKEDDEEFKKLFEDDDEKPKQPLKINMKIIAVIAAIAGIVIIALILFKSGGEDAVKAERSPDVPEIGSEQPAPAPSPVPEVKPAPVEPPKNDLVEEQREQMRRPEPKETPRKAVSAPKQSVVPKQATGPKKGSVKGFVKKGWALADAGDNDSAIELFMKAIEIDPGEGEAYYGLGYAYQAKGQKAKAKEYFQKALQSRLKASDKADIQSILNNL